MKKLSPTFLSRLIIISLFVAVLAGSWDAWWHGAVGRDTLWEPPHLLLYGAIVVAILTGMYGWYKTRQRIWRRLAILLILIPAARRILYFKVEF